MACGRLPFEMVSARQVEVFWQARKMGLSVDDVAQAAGISCTCAKSYLRRTGGIAPQVWDNPDRLLSWQERWRIKELLVEGCSLREIGRRLGRSASTISREIRRGGATASHPRQYRPTMGQRACFEARRRPKPLKITSHPQLRALVQQGLDDKLSPEQIAGRLRRDFPDRKDLHVSHETIYKTIYLQARGQLKRDVKIVTRTGRTLRASRRRAQERRGRITGMVSIWDRPPEALDRSIPGHWEGDLIVGKDGASAIATIVERHSNYLILGWLDPSMDRVHATQKVLEDKLARLPDTLKRTLTWDRGKEMTNHHHISVATNIKIYFADPHSPWQRATNENTNGLLRQYFPKGTDLSIHTQDDLDYVADQMNRRPRKRLHYATPYEVLSTHLLQ